MSFNRVKRKTIQAIVFLCALLPAVLLGMSGCVGRAILYDPQPVSEHRVSEIRERFEIVTEVTVRSDPGIDLHGWLIEKDRHRLPSILYFGGNSEEVSLNIEDFVRRIPANMILFNYRGYGLSDGRPSEANLKNDALRIYEYVVKRWNLDTSQIIIMGRSLGTGIAAYLSARFNVEKTILVSPYESITKVAYDFAPKFLVDALLQDRYETIDIANRLTHRILIFIAGKDEVIRPYHSEALFTKIPGQKRLIEIDEARHNTFPRYEKYWHELDEFIRS
jgi:uncharacterized protein